MKELVWPTRESPTFSIREVREPAPGLQAIATRARFPATVRVLEGEAVRRAYAAAYRACRDELREMGASETEAVRRAALVARRVKMELEA